jgi:hypothetical protein
VNAVTALAAMPAARKFIAHQIATPQHLRAALRTNQRQAALQLPTARLAAPTFNGKAPAPQSLVAKASRAQKTRDANP